jgi:hypothetical protein
MKGDIKQVNAVADRLGMSKEERDEFRHYLHDHKRRAGIQGHMPFQDLLDLGREFLRDYRDGSGGDQ